MSGVDRVGEAGISNETLQTVPEGFIFVVVSLAHVETVIVTVT